MKCEDCKWWHSIIANPTFGDCKLFPKKENKSANDCCGKFEAKAGTRPSPPIKGGY